jgi:predicted RNA-binding protein with RPS1 domain
VERYAKDLAIGGRRSVPYIDATIAWLVENATMAEESLGNNNPFRPQAAISPQGDQGAQATADKPKLAPNQLAFIMAAKSPEVLRSLQSIAEQQENLRAQVGERIANVDRVASLAIRAIVGERELPNVLVPYKQESQSFVDKMNQLKTQTDLRDLVKTQTEIVGWLAMNQLTSAQNLELLLLKLVEEGVKTRQILLEESTREIEERITELEKIKNEITTNVLSLAEDATRSLSLLDNIDNMVSVLAVSDRAGLVLTEEQFEAMLNRSSPGTTSP